MACNNTQPCTCPNTQCKYYGKCCACVEFHRNSGTVPSCFPKEEEAAKMRQMDPGPPRERPKVDPVPKKVLFPCDNDRPCPCRNLKCINRAKCCECVARHRGNGTLTNCMYTKEQLDARDREMEAMMAKKKQEGSLISK